LADSGVIENVQSTQFEVAIGSSGTIESIEQMIHHTALSTESQALDSTTLRDREFTADELGMVVKKVIMIFFSTLSINTLFEGCSGNLSWVFLRHRCMSQGWWCGVD
jgi:hypothetical protein